MTVTVRILDEPRRKIPFWRFDRLGLCLLATECLSPLRVLRDEELGSVLLDFLTLCG